MFQNNFESDPSTLNLSDGSSKQAPSCKFQCNSVLAFIVLGFIFLIMGMIELITNYQELSYRLPLKYNNNNNTIVSPSNYVSFTNDDTIAIYLHFQSLTQLTFTNKFDGEDIHQFDQFADNCLQFKFNYQTQKIISINNHTLNPNAFSIPCGKFPSMWLGDSIKLALANGTFLPLQFNDLSVFSYDVRNFDPNLQWVSFQNALFQNWMEQNVGIDTYKFIGTVNGRFQSQIYLQIELLNSLASKAGKMEVILSNNKALGGSNPSFCYMNFIQSGLMFVFALAAYLYRKIMKETVKGESSLSERKIELRANFQAEMGKTIQF